MSDPSEAISRPRLGYLFSRYPIVSHTFCDNEMLALDQRGWELTIFSPSPPKQSLRHERLTHAELPVVYGPPDAIAKALQTQAENDGSWPSELVARHDAAARGQGSAACRQALAMKELIQRSGISHLHMHFAGRAAHIAFFLKHLAGMTYSFTPQASDFLANPQMELILPELLRESDFVVSPCEFVVEKLREMFPATPMRLIKVFNGIDPHGYFSADPGSRPGPLRMVSVGRLVEFKGFAHLLRAMALALKDGADLELEILGDGPLRSELESMAADPVFTGRVHLRGAARIEDMKCAFARSDLFALACVVDNQGASDVLPTVITEAMLSQLPVLSSRVAAVPEQVEHGKTGILTDPGDERALADAMIRFAREPGLARAMGQAALERARTHFSLNATIPLLEAEFSKATSRRLTIASWTGVALFDLACETDCAALRADHDGLIKGGRAVVVAGGTVDPTRAMKMRLPWAQFFWVPDGMALEMEWINRKSEALLLTNMRRDLPRPLDGESFFLHTRRALWLAVFARSRAISGPLDTTEAMWPTAWLANHLTPQLILAETYSHLRPNF